MWRRRYLLAVPVALMLAAGSGVGCFVTTPRTVEPTRLVGPYRVEVYKGGRPVRESAFAAGSLDERAVAAWLESHRDGWTPSFVSYVPSRMIRGNGFNLNLRSDGLFVLNYGLPNHPQQGVRWVTAQDAVAIVAATGGE